MNNEEEFSFEISLSVLNHLGRQLYRNFATVLGEAISNAWDADAKNVWITIDRENAALLIKDDGSGMTSSDFQGKFLKIGYTKRIGGQTKTVAGRPFHGRKGIGKLALLSSAEKIAVISKTAESEYIGGVIDNSGLDEAIEHDLTPDQYPLEAVRLDIFSDQMTDHNHGTIIFFENVKEGINNTLETLKKTIALYFRFSLLDESFNIFINGELVTIENLEDIITKTQFMWKLNQLKDPYIDRLEEVFTPEKNEIKVLNVTGEITGFIASVIKPSDLKIRGTEEELTVDLFVNGRLRERDILRHITTARVTESYLYGQIHFNSLDDEVDRFTTSRESVISNDSKFQDFLKTVRDEVLGPILTDWDKWRRDHKADGDSEDTRISRKQRKSGELYNAVASDYESADDESEEAKKVETWVNDLSDDASFSFSSFAECYIAENLVRKYIQDQGIALTDPANTEVTKWRNKETVSKTAANININIRKDDADLNYLDMTTLSKVVDSSSGTNNMPTDAKQYKPLRDALMHTSLLSDAAKTKLTSVFDNIKGRVKTLLS